jgi:hypothetical protein
MKIIISRSKNFNSLTPKEHNNFRHWFGNSVVSNNGNPIMLFHGTSSDIHLSDAKLFWAAVDHKFAAEYAALHESYDLERSARANILPVYMSIQKPFDADTLPKTITIGTFFNEVLKQSGLSPKSEAVSKLKEYMDLITKGRYEEESGPYYARHDFWFNARSMFGAKASLYIVEAMKICGFDGIRNTETGTLTFGTFTPNQVKSALGNNGNFDPSSKDITK